MSKIPEMEAGPCLWCEQWVEPKREEAGATRPLDPCWATVDGDYGCFCSPETTEEGTGDHARPYDLALALLRSPPGVVGGWYES